MFPQEIPIPGPCQSFMSDRHSPSLKLCDYSVSFLGSNQPNTSSLRIVKEWTVTPYHKFRLEPPVPVTVS